MKEPTRHERSDLVAQEPSIAFVTGDATAPEGEDVRIIAHVCNDIGAWGAGSCSPFPADGSGLKSLTGNGRTTAAAGSRSARP